MSNFIQCAAYIRLSREDGDKEESDSVGNQRKLLTEYIQKNENFTLYHIYVDDGYTGTNFNRPAFQQMLLDIKNGNVHCVIVKDLSRFGRDYIDTGWYLERIFPTWNIRFISITDGIDSFHQAYDLMLPIKNIFNEQYARDISKKIHTTIQTKQQTGEFIGAFASYGYKKSPTDKNKLIVDDYAANIVRKIFSLYLQGIGKQSIAKILNSEGVLCPSEYKAINGERYHNSNRLPSTSYWTYSTIHSILHNEMYIGTMVQGKKCQHMRSKQSNIHPKHWIRIEHTHEAIIDSETWNKTQFLLKKKYQNPTLSPHNNIFAGFIKCGDCGRSMIQNSWKTADGSIHSSFYCGTYKRSGKDYCSSHILPLEVLNNIILDDLNRLFQSPINLKELVKTQTFHTPSSSINSEKTIVKLTSECNRIKSIKASIYRDYKDELITKEEFLNYRTYYQKRETLYRKQIEELEQSITETTQKINFENVWLENLLNSNTITELDRLIIIEMIDHITVYENHHIKITYSFSNEFETLLSKSFSNPPAHSSVTTSCVKA